MYRAIIEVTVKLVVDIDTDAFSNGFFYPSLEGNIKKGLDEFFEDTHITFTDTENVAVVDKYSSIKKIERV